MNPFVLLFSPTGSTGRFGWWMGQIFLLFFIGASAFFLFVIFERALGAHSWSDMVRFEQMAHSWTKEDWKKETDLIKSKVQTDDTLKPYLAGLSLCGILYLWCGICIEVKRWRDLNLSRFMYLTRLIPGVARHFVSPLVAGIILLVVFLVRLYFLGFAPSPGAVANKMQRRTPTQLKPKGSGNAVGVVFGAIFAMIVTVAIAAGVYFGLGTAIKSGKIIVPANVAAYLPASLSPADKSAPQTSVSTAPPAPVIIPTQGTDSTDFAKDWVVVKDRKFTGITGALPVPGDEVVLIYSDGAKSIPASSLPQGFLNLWRITPDALKAQEKK